MGIASAHPPAPNFHWGDLLLVLYATAAFPSFFFLGNRVGDIRWSSWYRRACAEHTAFFLPVDEDCRGCTFPTFPLLVRCGPRRGLRAPVAASCSVADLFWFRSGAVWADGLKCPMVRLEKLDLCISARSCVFSFFPRRPMRRDWASLNVCDPEAGAASLAARGGARPLFLFVGGVCPKGATDQMRSW